MCGIVTQWRILINYLQICTQQNAVDMCTYIKIDIDIWATYDQTGWKSCVLYLCAGGEYHGFSLTLRWEEHICHDAQHRCLLSDKIEIYQHSTGMHVLSLVVFLSTIACRQTQKSQINDKILRSTSHVSVSSYEIHKQFISFS